MKTLPLAAQTPKPALLKKTTCPNCWFNFLPEESLWISVHSRLAGEARLPTSTTGRAEQKRFIAERFDVEGRAIDAEGSPCTQIACPRCLLSFPRAALEVPSIVYSLLGAPGSGKSVFLASMTFMMRQQAAALGLRFQDGDLTLNKLLLEDERRLFLDAGSDGYRQFDEAVQKTQTDDIRYRTSIIDGHEARFVYPFTFLIAPAAGHPYDATERSVARLLCLYDNAGEHFLPGVDTAEAPMTRHLAASDGIMYTFDPTKDRRFLRELGERGDARAGSDRQDTVLMEAANRVRDHAGLSSTTKIPQTLVVVLTKFDVWRSLLPRAQEVSPLRMHPNGRIQVVSRDDLDTLSHLCHGLLRRLCPEVVSAAESVSDSVYYVPAAAVGMDVQKDLKSGAMKFRGAECEPHGVLVPLLSLLTNSAPRLVQSVRKRS